MTTTNDKDEAPAYARYIKANPSKPLTLAEWEVISDELFKILRLIKDTTNSLEARLDVVERLPADPTRKNTSLVSRVAQLEAQLAEHKAWARA